MNLTTHANAQYNKKITKYVNQTASDLHDGWRANRALPDGGFEPRIKPDGEGGEVDIANTEYKDLPQKWKAENLAAATAVVKDITTHPDADLEELADRVHVDWLSRNGQWAPAEQQLPYAKLSEELKQLDRDVVQSAKKAITAVDSW